MKNLIIASGHLGSTLKAAELLSNLIGGADILDTNKKSPLPLEQYDNYIFGGNIRIFHINKRMKKWSKKLKNDYKNKRVFVYLVGADKENAAKYVTKARKIFKSASDVRHVGGELNAEHATGMSKNIILSVIKEHEQQGKELPKILEEELQLLAQKICGQEA